MKFHRVESQNMHSYEFDDHPGKGFFLGWRNLYTGDDMELQARFVEFLEGLDECCKNNEAQDESTKYKGY